MELCVGLFGVPGGDPCKGDGMHLKDMLSFGPFY